MPATLCLRPSRRLELERLEDRLLLSAGDSIANAIGLPLTSTSGSVQTAHVSEYLANPGDVELNRISVEAGDVVTALINTAPYGGGLSSAVRIFQQTGTNPVTVQQIASTTNFEGQESGLSFQAPTTGTYYVGISSFDNATYNPLVAGSGSGSSHGLFDLNLSVTPAALAPDLVPSSFQIGQSEAVWGDTVTINYTIQNRGGQDAAAGSVSLLLSADNRFDDAIPALQSAPLPALSAGAAYQGSFSVTLGAPGTPPPSFSACAADFSGIGDWFRHADQPGAGPGLGSPPDAPPGNGQRNQQHTGRRATHRPQLLDHGHHSAGGRGSLLPD